MNNLFAIYKSEHLVLLLDHINQSDLQWFAHDELDSFLHSKSKNKIAVIEIDYFNVDNSRKIIEQLENFCQFIVIQSMEMSSKIMQLIIEYDKPNIVYVLNSIFNFSLKKSKIYNEYFHLLSITYPYYHEWDFLRRQRCHPFLEKKFMFDVLPGKPKEHRVFLKNQIKELDSKPWFYQANFFDYKDIDNINLEKDFWEDEVLESKREKEFIMYHGLRRHIGSLVPFKIYDKTAYSLICETQFSNSYSFFTEKIAKPIVGCRLFIVLSGQYYLKNLKTLGLMTFHGIIDESYDLENDPHKRWKMAIDQAIDLCRRPQKEILSKIVPIVLHNYKQMPLLNQNLAGYCVEKFLLEKKLTENNG